MRAWIEGFLSLLVHVHDFNAGRRARPLPQRTLERAGDDDVSRSDAEADREGRERRARRLVRAAGERQDERDRSAREGGPEEDIGREREVLGLALRGVDLGAGGPEGAECTVEIS